MWSDDSALSIYRYTKYGKGKVIAEWPVNLNCAQILQINEHYLGWGTHGFPLETQNKQYNSAASSTEVSLPLCSLENRVFYGSCIFSLSEVDGAQEQSSLVHMHTYTFFDNHLRIGKHFFFIQICRKKLILSIIVKEVLILAIARQQNWDQMGNQIITIIYI